MVSLFRFAELSFLVSENSTLHGFAGTFECELFQDTLMSIMPKVVTTLISLF